MAVDISSFLTEGAQVPSGSAVKATQSETVLPPWYTNYAQQLLSNQQALATQPYQTYQGPRVAEFSPAQQQAFNMTGQAATAYQPALAQATQTTQQALAAPGALTTAQPYFTQATQLNPSAVAGGDYGTARNLATQAANADILGAATPYYGQSMSSVQQGVGTSGVAAAQPYLAQAGQSAADVSAYMNPYTEQVVNRIGELGARNLSEKLMPSITSKYISAGQLGYGPRGGAGTPSGMLTDTARALRDVNADVLAQQSQALQSGYSQAQQTAQADLARQAQLASTAGNLTQAQQQALLQAGQQQAAIGTQVGNLTQAQQAGALSAAGQLAGLGTSAAGLTQEQQQLLASMGAQAGNLATAQTGQQLTGAEQLGALGQTAQSLGLTGANAMAGVGATQQAQAQKNLDTAYSDFLAQKGYPQEQINNMLAALKGTASSVPTATKEYGIVPAGQTAQNQPSTAATIGAALTGGAALAKELKSLFA